MKKRIGIMLTLVLLSCAAFTTAVVKRTGEPAKQEGLYIFILSTPTDEYEHLGTVKSPGVVMSKDFEDLLRTMVKRAKKEHPNADALLFNTGTIYTCDAVKFK